MKKVELSALSLAPVAAAIYDVDKPSENQERLAYNLNTILLALQAQNFEFTAVETSDFATFNTDMNSWLDDANARFDAWLQGAIGEAIGNVPDAIAIGSAFVSGGATEVGAIILEKMLNHMFHVEDSRAQYEGAHENVDTDAIVNKLEEVRAQIEATLNEFNINLYNDADDSSVKYGQLDT